MRRPAYEDGSLVNLASSIASALGGRPAHPPLALLPPSELDARTVVLLLLDGLGYHYLRARPESRLARDLRGPITSVFPSTTASALTSVITGLTPQEHGVTGWFTWLAEVGTVAAILPFRPRFGGRPFSLAGVSARAVLRLRALADDVPARSFVVTHQDLVASDFSAAVHQGSTCLGHHSLAELFAHVLALVRGGEGRQYVFAYWRDLDGMAHKQGLGSPQVARHFEMIDRAYAAFLEAARGADAVVVTTADHGLVDVARERIVRLEDHPALAATLALPLCAEPRAAYAYVRPGRGPDLERYVRSVLDHACTVHPAEELLERGFFGCGAVEPRARSRIGDYVLLPRDGWAIKDRLLGEDPFAHVGMHGGLTDAELDVPVCVARP